MVPRLLDGELEIRNPSGSSISAFTMEEDVYFEFIYLNEQFIRISFYLKILRMNCSPGKALWDNNGNGFRRLGSHLNCPPGRYWSISTQYFGFFLFKMDMTHTASVVWLSWLSMVPFTKSISSIPGLGCGVFPYEEACREKLIGISHQCFSFSHFFSL